MNGRGSGVVLFRLVVVLLGAHTVVTGNGCSESQQGSGDGAADAAISDAHPGDMTAGNGDLHDASSNDVAPSTDGLADAPDQQISDTLAADTKPPPPLWPPDKFGPYSVGLQTMNRYDSTRKKWIEIKVWYPGKKPAAGTKTVSYIPFILNGKSFAKLPLETSAAPYPLVLFSHGNKGINFQSYTFTEYLASHGFVVASPNHPGNTMINNPSDQQIAQIALERPGDVAFAQAQLLLASTSTGDPLHGAVKASVVGISGHSFGGYTSLLISGAEVDVNAAAARCKAGTPAKIFCPYINYWPAGKIISRPASLAGVKAGLALAPGGFAAFGAAGLQKIKIPMMIMGGTLDSMTTLLHEVQPIFNNISTSPRYKVEITKAGHMSFTDICRIPGSGFIPGLDEFCKPGKYIKIDRGFEIINALGVAFFRYHLKGEAALKSFLTAAYAAKFPEASFVAK